MSGAILETERSAFEELERIEEAIANRIIYNPKILPDTHALSRSSSLNGKRKRAVTDTLLHQLEVARFLDRYQEQCEFLEKMVAKSDESETSLASQHKAEVASLGGGGASSKALYDQFYEQVVAIKEFHRRYPNEGIEDLEASYKMRKLLPKPQQSDDTEDGIERRAPRTNGILSTFAADINLDTLFSGEEYYGRFLDLVGFHERFLNLRFVQRQVSYIQYLDKFHDFYDKSLYSAGRLRDADYFQYITELHSYLESFLKKTRILGQPEIGLVKMESDFDSAWENKSLPGWLSQDEASGPEPTNNNENGIYCEPCGKAFSNQAVYDNHLNGRKHKKNAEAGTKSMGQDNLKFRALAFHEYHVNAISELITKQIIDTKSNVERRQALTDRERQLEVQSLEREAMGEGSDEDDNDQNSDDEEDDIIYNPLKLPLGWDGKPIPFWLWKLNGLGIEYPCEICGNFCYMGRKVFDKHFLEPRHNHGLRCLGITPSLLFKGITKISDALTLWDKVRKENRKQEGKQESTVEMEDEEGNVMTEKVYNDLKKQGLI